jgi:2-dehydro-3-deoxy-D-arabinonate dehydratase
MSELKLYRTAAGAVLESGDVRHALPDPWDALVNREDLHAYLAAIAAGERTVQRERAANAERAGDAEPLAPIGSQEVWAAGVTYYRSRAARIEESRDAGGGTFYDRVYEAERPELFFKAAAWRVRGPGEEIRVRADARWSVPEPELALYINARGEIIGCTIGNDVSSRDIEGENPLYLPQAKVYDGSCALGPAVLITPEPLPPETAIRLRIERDGATAFEDATTLAQLKRTPASLAEWLFRETSFPTGAVLLTGTGIVPPDDFTLRSGDIVTITIPPIGSLTNPVE